MEDFKQEEIEFNKLHQKLLDLKLYDLATDLSKNFWSYGHKKFIHGMGAAQEIYAS